MNVELTEREVAYLADTISYLDSINKLVYVKGSGGVDVDSMLAKLRNADHVEVWEPVENETNLKGRKDGFQITVKPEMLMVESFWYWGEIPLPDNIRLCRRQEGV